MPTSISFAMTARLREGETAGESSAFCRSSDAAIIVVHLPQLRRSPVSASMPEPGSVTTSTSALA